MNESNLIKLIPIVCPDCKNSLRALTHLIVSPELPLYREISDYQKKREKRI